MTHWSLLFVCLVQEYFWHLDNWVCHYTPPGIYELFSLSPACQGHWSISIPVESMKPLANRGMTACSRKQLKAGASSWQGGNSVTSTNNYITETTKCMGFWVLLVGDLTSSTIENWEAKLPENPDWGNHCYSWSLAPIPQLHPLPVAMNLLHGRHDAIHRTPCCY